MAELNHPLSRTYTSTQAPSHWQTCNSSAMILSLFYRQLCDTGMCLCMCRCVALCSGIKKWLCGNVGDLLSKEKLGCLTTTDHRNTATETETQRREERKAGELGYKMIPALWGLIIIYAPGSFLSFSFPNQINHHRSLKPSLSLCSLSFFPNLLLLTPFLALSFLC